MHLHTGDQFKGSVDHDINFDQDTDPNFDALLNARFDERSNSSPLSTSSTTSASTTCSYSRLSSFAIHCRSDSHLVKKVRQQNMVAIAKLQKQHASLTTLRKNIVTRLKSSHCQSYRKRRVPGYRSVTAKLSCSDGEQRNTAALASPSKRGSCRYDDNHHALNGHRLLHIYLDAIDNVQKTYQRIRRLKFRDDLIKRSTLPVITLQGDITKPGMGVIGFSGRLLHASNLEDLIQRCLEKQQCLLSEASASLTAPLFPACHTEST